MDGSSRSGGFRQSRRSRSQRDRERRRRRADLAEHRASSPSSASDQELCRDSLLRASRGECRPGFPGTRHRPPRRRKRESVSCEEDIIDGFAIASFISLEALEMDCSLKPPDRSGLFMGRGIKRKRGLDENGGPLSEPEEGPPATYTNSWEQRRKIKSKLKRKGDAKVSGNHMETGYICDTESESGDKASDNMEPAFIICTREAVNSNSASAAASNGCPLLPSNSSQPLLSVTPRVSGLQRSQERSMEQPYPEPISTSSSLPSLAGRSTASVSNSLPEQRNGNGGPYHRHDPSPTQHKHKPFLFSGKPQSIYSNNRSSNSGKPPSSSASSSIRPPTPATSASLVRGSGGVGTVIPSSRPSPGAVFTPSPNLPPPPPLLQVSPHTSTDPDLICKDLTDSNAGSAPRGPSVSSSNCGTSSRSSQAQTSIPAMAYQFHQHNHQHQHTHTHQHFLHPTAAPPPLFDKYPGKIDGLFRHPFFPQYPPPVPVLPPTGPFRSLHGAFQPKLVALQGAAPEMAAGLGVVPPHLPPKASRLTDPFAPPPKLLHADPQKLDFRNDLLPRLPGPGIGGIGGLGPLGGPLAPTPDLTRPGSLFTGGVNLSSTPFMPPSMPHSSFLTSAAHLDPYVRSSSYSSLGALSSGAFGGLGSPTIVANVLGHKTEPSASAVGGLGNPHDPWNRLHVTPASFPSGSWAKGPEKRDDRGKDVERREPTHIKDEKDRDSLLYGRQPVRMSPGVPSHKHRSSTPSSHLNGLGPLSGGGVQSDGQSRERDRERERESDKRQHSASRAPVSTSSAAPDRPRSSTSSILTASPSNVPSAPSPLDLFHRQPPHTLSTESSHSSQRENNGPASSSSLPVKKPDRTTTPVSKPTLGLTAGLLLPQVKVKEERKEEPEPVPISLLHSAVPSHNFERPNSRHPHHPSTPSSTLSLTPTPGVPLPPPTPHPPHHPLSLLDRPRGIDAYLGGAGGSAGLVLGAADRFPQHPHGPPQGHSQATHFPWEHWRDLAAQQQQRREVLALRSDPHFALRSDPHFSRLLQHQQVQRYLEAERAAVAAAVASSPHHPPVPTSLSSASSSAGRPEFGLMSHPFDEEQRAQLMREDLERARYLGMHPHLSAPHLPSPSHAAHLEQLHAGLLSHSHLQPAGASSQASHHPGLYSRLGPLHSHSHLPNGILAKAPGLVGALSVGAPPPLISSVNRSSTPPRGPRLGGAGDLALFTTHKDGESR
ncbi:autism susceptibility gene 2 protein-like isoform X5 [Carassius carassius]|uniref:autism susceptibility gene 2 protein-like isoform X5 n=1 Tax=Carassius carassius TaxID=217509 RepID=UPI0028697FEA|nr:autism susceptibility gene 2 protein-like isoform X5 [Carassius carassius]